MKSISVIVPIFNAEKFLPYLFNCFDKCAFTEADEVLLVDNGSKDKSYEMCLAQANNRPGLYRVLQYTEKADSYAARNHAVSQAKGGVFAFTDSDCKPFPTWLDEARKVEEGVVMAGKVELELVENNLWEHLDRLVHLGQTEEAIRRNCVPTANMAVNRNDFFHVGRFEERFSGGDFEWSQRACSKGLAVKYTPAAFMYHPSRKTFEEISTREKRTAYGQGNSCRNNGKSKAGLVLRYFLKIFKIDTNFRLSRGLAKSGVNFKDRLYFNVKFFQIRVMQLKAAIAGYDGVNARDLKIK